MSAVEEYRKERVRFRPVTNYVSRMIADAAISEMEAKLRERDSDLHRIGESWRKAGERIAGTEAERDALLRLAFEDAYPLIGDTYDSGGIYRKWLADLRTRADERPMSSRRRA